MVWSESIALFVAVETQRLLADSQADSGSFHRAATLSQALPVYCDMGGCLALMRDGSVVEVDLETGRVARVDDRSSIRLAYAAAAERYAELAGIRPTDGRPCTVCGGTGKRAVGRCAVCDGTGLVADVSAQ